MGAGAKTQRAEEEKESILPGTRQNGRVKSKGNRRAQKGRGKGKGGWPGPYADADGEALKKKEKPGDK